MSIFILNKSKRRRMMSSKRFFSVFSLLIVSVILFTACGPSQTATQAPATQPPGGLPPATQAPATQAPAMAVKIGFLAGTNDPFYTTMQRGAAQAAADLGVELVTQIPQNWNVTDQTPMLDAMVARGDLSFLFLAPVDSQAMIAPLQKASDAGIPMLTVDTFIGDGDYLNGPVKFPLSFIASDNYLGGQIACRALADAIGKTGKIYIQNVRPGISSTDAREKGCEDVIKAEYPNVIIAGVDYNEDDASKAQAQTDAMLTKTPDLAGIFGTNVFSAQGAGTVVANKGLSGKVKVVAFDATASAIEMLKNNTVDLVIAQKPSDMGFFAVEMAMAYMNGVTSIPVHIPTGYAVITRDNMNDPNISKFFYK
jgi:ribose transport system substrate-binding protein